jgi:hypothetical protein
MDTLFFYPLLAAFYIEHESRVRDNPFLAASNGLFPGREKVVLRRKTFFLMKGTFAFRKGKLPLERKNFSLVGGSFFLQRKNRGLAGGSFQLFVPAPGSSIFSIDIICIWKVPVTPPRIKIRFSPSPEPGGVLVSRHQ